MKRLASAAHFSRLLAAMAAGASFCSCSGGQATGDAAADVHVADTLPDTAADLANDGVMPGDLQRDSRDAGADLPGTDIGDTTDASDDGGPDVIFGCCADDGDCGEGVCAGGTDVVQGTCHVPAAFGSCWRDSDCYATQKCEGEIICPCAMLCIRADEPGHCAPLPAGCCNNDGDCADGQECRGIWPGDKLPGACVPSHTGPECLGDQACCWNDSDCPGGGTCSGVSVCGCIELCWVCGACMPDQMGYCTGS